jgi:hypothetical protein
MREPLVDTVDKRQIVTDHFPLKVSTINTRYTQKKKEKEKREQRMISNDILLFADIRHENDHNQRYQY